MTMSSKRTCNFSQCGYVANHLYSNCHVTTIAMIKQSAWFGLHLGDTYLGCANTVVLCQILSETCIVEISGINCHNMFDNIPVYHRMLSWILFAASFCNLTFPLGSYLHGLLTFCILLFASIIHFGPPVSAGIVSACIYLWTNWRFNRKLATITLRPCQQQPPVESLSEDDF